MTGHESDHPQDPPARFTARKRSDATGAPQADRTAQLRDELEHLLAAAQEIAAAGKARFISDRGSVERLAAEALVIHFDDAQTKRVPASVKARIPDVRWDSLSGARNIFAHDYRQVRSEMLWEMVKDYLPHAITRILDEL